MISDGERLQKVLARLGYGSRRVCEEIIAGGRVRIDGEVAVLGQRVAEDQRLEVDGIMVGHRPDLVHYLVNKPRGLVCSADDEMGRPVVLDLVPDAPRVFSVGRLDMDTEGLIIVTNDGDLAHVLTHPSHGVEKEYLAHVCPAGEGGDIHEGGPVPRGILSRLRNGVDIGDGHTLPAKVTQPTPGVVRITIHEGRNRQIRRMFEALGWQVIRLVRVRIGPIADPALAPGCWRVLRPGEIIALRRASNAG